LEVKKLAEGGCRADIGRGYRADIDRGYRADIDRGYRVGPKQ